MVVKRRPTKESYEMHQIDDIINNVPGSTDALMMTVGGEPDQINLIASDVRRLLLKKAEIFNNNNNDDN